jgi:group I intron endonuclease
MNSGIYAIKSVGGKCYVGSAVHISRRWAEHRKHLKAGTHHSRKLQNAWNKHGASAFAFVLLEAVANKEMLIEREQHWIDAMGACALGYNSRPVATSMLGFKHSPETIERCRAMNLGRRMPEHVKAALLAANLGRKQTEEHKEKLAASNRGKKRPAHVIAAVVAAHTGMKRSEETRLKISRGALGNTKRLGHRHSDETKARIAEAKRGRKLSAEHRAKISAAQKGKPKKRKDACTDLNVTFYDLAARE